jgi:hypothetical protein
MYLRLKSSCKDFPKVVLLSEHWSSTLEHKFSSLSHDACVIRGSNVSNVSVSVARNGTLKQGNPVTKPKARYLHGTLKDLFERPDIWNKIVAGAKAPLYPYRLLCRFFILQLKICHPDDLTLNEFWDLVTCCVEYAAQTEKQIGEAEVRLMNLTDRLLNLLVGPERS